MRETNLYDRVAQEAAAIVIRRYSTSFTLASRLLAPQMRTHVCNIYALVRVADELVDGGTDLDPAAAGRALDALEEQTERALSDGFSANLIVHAFVLTALAAGFGSEYTRPFFESMRTDLHRVIHDQESFDRYVYGSAEVVGLMCLRAFLLEEPARFAALAPGAQALGAAFQKVNFLRDLAADYEQLGRSYFPGVDIATFDEATKARLLDDIDADLALSATTVPQLPASSRRAVALAQSLFQELSNRLRRTPADRLVRTRVRVPVIVKARLAAAAAVGRMP